MLRFKILASAVPLVAAALFARGGLLPGPHPCIAIASASVEIADLPWRADLHVAFTDDPAEATVRVQVTAVTPETSRIPRAMVLTVSFVVSPESRACCLRHP